MKTEAEKEIDKAKAAEEYEAAMTEIEIDMAKAAEEYEAAMALEVKAAHEIWGMTNEEVPATAMKTFETAKKKVWEKKAAYDAVCMAEWELKESVSGDEG
jgi:hypothetical protein